MIVLIIVLSLFLIASVLMNVYQHNELLDARHRAYNAEAWIDPISIEEVGYDYE